MSTQLSDTWKQLDGLNADTAEDAGWYAESIEKSPTLGYRMQLINPNGALVALGWSPSRLGTADTVRTAQAAYGQTQS